MKRKRYLPVLWIGTLVTVVGLVALMNILSAWADMDTPFVKLPNKPPTPIDNPFTQAKVELGKKLYFDPRLSIDGTVSCNSCHNVMAGGDDSRAVSVGVKGQRGTRSAPTVFNSAFLTVQFWDGREPSLEAQAKGPITNPIEMGMPNHALAIKRLKIIRGYKAEFKRAFKGRNPINIDNVAKAIATYERTLVTPNSPYDRYLAGNKKVMSSTAQKGMKTFKKVGCALCHFGPILAGESSPMGEGYFREFPVYAGSKYEKQYALTKDKGRAEVTKNEDEEGIWRVAQLRNIALTAPYFHNGKVQKLDMAVRVMGKMQINRDLNRTETRQIVAFLESLTGEIPKQTMPLLPLETKSSLLSTQP